MQTQAKALTKIITISTFITLISGCGSSDSDGVPHSDLDPLPGANSSLDTRTPEGIWLIQSGQTGNYTLSEAEVYIDTVKSVQQFVVIQERVDGSYSMPQCGLQLFKEHKHLSLVIENNQVVDSGTSYQTDKTEQIYSLNLSIEDNLKMEGIIDVVTKNSGDLFIFKDHQIANISAVKVSDSSDFESAKELSISFSAQLNGDAEQSLIDLIPSINCLSVSSARHTGTQVGQDSLTNVEAVFITDVDDNSARFNLNSGTLGSEAIVDKSYFSSLISLLSSGVPSCATDDHACVLTNTLTLSQSSKSNSITANAAATNEDDESLNISFSVEIK